ncbi:MAG: hypothetical protein ACRCWI_00130 [Brevinema sp.]
MSKRSKFIMFFTFFSILWFLNGIFNVFSIANQRLFWEHQWDSAMLVQNDLIVKDQIPDQDKPFFQVVDWFGPEKKKNIESLTIFSGYTSHIGLQSIILYPIYYVGSRVFFKGDPFSQWKSYRLTQVTVAFVTALVLALFLTFLAIEFGVLSVTVMGLWVILTNVWLTISIRNIYWMLWTWFLPFLCTAWFLYFNKQKSWWLYFSVFFTITLKSAMGYEYLTTIMVMATLPVFYFSISRSWSKVEFISVFVKVSLSCIVAVLFTLIVQILLAGGVDNILNRLYERTINLQVDDTAYLDKKGIFLYFTWGAHYHIPFSVAVFLEIVAILARKTPLNTFIGVGTTISPEKYLALVIVVILSFFGTMSHHLIFMQHSLIHTHVNFILWFVPFWFFMVLLVLQKPPTTAEFILELKKIGK